MNKIYSVTFFVLVAMIVMANAQTSIVQLPGLKADTINLKVDTVNMRVYVSRKDSILGKDKKYNIERDKNGRFVFKTSSDLEYAVKSINIYSDNNVYPSDSLINSLNKHNKVSIIFYREDNEFIPSQVENTTNNLIEDKTDLDGFGYFTPLLIGIGILFASIGIFFLYKWRRAENKISTIRQLNNNEFSNQFKQFIKNHYPESFIELVSKKPYPHEYIETINRKLKGFGDKLSSTENDLRLCKSSLEEKEAKISKLNSTNHELEQNIAIEQTRLKEEYEASRAELINLSDKMVSKYIEFKNSMSNKTDQELIRLIMDFHFSYTQLSFALFRHICNTDDASSEMNLRLLKGDYVEPRKQIDQFTAKDEAEYWIILMIKYFEQIGIKQIDGAFINGNKIAIK